VACPLSDPQVLAPARAERRAIVTNNVRDYRPLHVDAVTPGGQGHFGMIFMSGNYRRTKSAIGRISRHRLLMARTTDRSGK